MDCRSIYTRICRHTKDAFGVATNPHLFRDGAATAVAVADPEHVGIIRCLLGHSTDAVAERHYNQAGAIEAGRRYAAVLDALRDAQADGR